MFNGARSIAVQICDSAGDSLTFLTPLGLGQLNGKHSQPMIIISIELNSHKSRDVNIRQLTRIINDVNYDTWIQSHVCDSL